MEEEKTGKIFSGAETIKRKVLFIGAIFFVCAFGLVWLFSSLQHTQDLNLESRSGEDGVIYFSARTNEPGYLSSLFALEVVSREVFVIENTKPNAITNTEHISPDQYRTVYSEAVLELKNDQYYLPGTSQLIVFDARNNTTSAVTHSNTYKANPEWSPSGTSIAFVSRDLTENTLALDSESWDVMVTDLFGSETFITNGFQPQWFPDGTHLLVLKNDGLYILNKDTQDEHKLSGIEEISMSSNMKMDLSRDGSRVALSLSDSGRVFIIKILSLDMFQGVIESEMPGQAFWPVFSEDGNSLALYEVDIDLLDTDPQPRIIVYNLETFEKKIIYDLSTFDPESVAITDWRK